MKDNLFDDETFLARWMAGEVSDTELEQFRKHPDFAFYERLANSPIKIQVPKIKEEQDLLLSIKAKANKEVPLVPKSQPLKSKLLTRRQLGGLLAAAVTLLLMGYFAFFKSDSFEYKTAIAEQQSIDLPDGSSVLLNPNSALVRPANNFNKNRRLTLNGEAFFEVEEGSTFRVETDNGIITVLGTQFSVYSREDLAVVMCKTGAVQVENNAGKRVILSAGNRVYIQQDRLSGVDTIPPESIATWKEGVSSFESEYLSIVTQAIENQFDIKITLPKKLAQERYTGSFLHQDIETALRMVFDPMNLKYRKLNDQEWEVVEN